MWQSNELGQSWSKKNCEGFKVKGSMIQHIFEYFPHSKTVYNREYVCKCKTCINLNFSCGLEEYKRVNLDETDKEVAVAGSTEVEVENDCELGNDDNDATRIYQFTEIPS